MGEAKRRRDRGERVSWCRSCTLCCSIPEIRSLDKPMYRPCTHLDGSGCGVFGMPERPAVCTAFQCAYLAARLGRTPEQNRIPHPELVGAYVAHDAAERLVALFVDPERPEIWKQSELVAYLRRFLRMGHTLEVTDRGRRMTIASEAIFDETLRRDYVAWADAQGWAREIDSFAETFPSER